MAFHRQIWKENWIQNVENMTAGIPKTMTEHGRNTYYKLHGFKQCRPDIDI